MKTNHNNTFLRLCILILATAFSLNNTFAQNVEFTKENMKANKNLRKVYNQFVIKGYKYYDLEQPIYSVALDYFLKANEQHQSSAYLNYLIADCYLHTQEKYKALNFIQKAVALDPSVAYNVDFVMGAAYHQEFEMEKAIFYLTKFKNAYKSQNPDKDSLLLVERLLEQANNGLQQIEFTDYELVNLGTKINTTFSEYVPLVTADNRFLIFTSRKPQESLSKKKKKMTHFYYNYDEDIYRSIWENGK